jgi:hypothetical protein
MKKLTVLTLGLAISMSFSVSASYVITPLQPVINKLCDVKSSSSVGKYKYEARKNGLTNIDLKDLESKPVCNGVNLGNISNKQTNQ